jgi:phosphoglycerol transferase
MNPEPFATAQDRPSRFGQVARFLLLWLACVLVALILWMRATFGEVTMGQIVFHWRYLGGSSSIAPQIATDFLVMACAVPLVVALLLLWLLYRVAPSPLLAGAVPAARHRAIARLGLILPIVVIVGCSTTLAAMTSAVQFLTPIGHVDYFADHYVPPAGVKLVPGKRKNLVLVYVESLEVAYRREDLFGRNLLSGLDAQNPVSFDSYEQMPGTGWTIAAMVSTQCGIPLQPVGILEPHDQGEFIADFLPGAVCLGDILHAQGYKNVFLGGAALAFSGKGKFLSGHHYHEVYGRDEWVRAGTPKSHISGWGLHDDDLFINAKRKLRELHDAGQPFNLTLLTVDTHWPSGFVSAGCKARGAVKLDDVVACTVDLVADLVQFIRESGMDADTSVVVIGDHLSPPNSLAEQLDQVPRRTIYNGFFSASAPTPNRRQVVHFDMLPTILDFIGLHPQGGRMGLGHTAFGAPADPIMTAASYADLAQQVLSPSRAYTGLWEPNPPAASAPIGLSGTQP